MWNFLVHLAAGVRSEKEFFFCVKNSFSSACPKPVIHSLEEKRFLACLRALGFFFVFVPLGFYAVLKKVTSKKALNI